jgi:hypothetical protein
MDIQELKKILATLSVAGLLTGLIPVSSGCTTSQGSCTGDKKGSQTEAVEEKAPAQETPAPSS